MRVTAKVKEKTETAILAAARRLFLRRGVEGTSTRDIAKSAKIATGTLFNYFVSKEELAFALAASAFDAGRELAHQRITADAASSLEMDLFTLIASDLRALVDLRTLVGDLLDAGLGRMSDGASEAATAVRAARIEDVNWVLDKHGVRKCSTEPLLHLYWSVYLGVLAFWSRDESPRQEDSLALLDQAVRMFAGIVTGPAGKGDRR